MADAATLDIRIATVSESDIDYAKRLRDAGLDIETHAKICIAGGSQYDEIGKKLRCFRRHVYTTVSTKRG